MAGFLSRSVNLSATRLGQLFNIETAVRGGLRVIDDGKEAGKPIAKIHFNETHYACVLSDAHPQLVLRMHRLMALSWLAPVL